MNLQDIKLEYIREELNKEDLKETPYLQFKQWMQEAIDSEITYPIAASLATVSNDGIPSSRTILIKDHSEEGLVLFSDYTSQKAIEVAENNHAALLFFWKEFDRQIRVQGKVSKIDPIESEKYWDSRPKQSQISALASNQSTEISKAELEQRVKLLSEEFKEKPIPRPQTWGGYRISFDVVEFWQGRPNRLHDRFRYIKNNNEWKISRLAP